MFLSCTNAHRNYQMILDDNLHSINDVQAMFPISKYLTPAVVIAPRNFFFVIPNISYKIV